MRVHDLVGVAHVRLFVEEGGEDGLGVGNCEVDDDVLVCCPTRLIIYFITMTPKKYCIAICSSAKGGRLPFINDNSYHDEQKGR